MKAQKTAKKPAKGVPAKKTSAKSAKKAPKVVPAKKISAKKSEKISKKSAKVVPAKKEKIVVPAEIEVSESAKKPRKYSKKEKKEPQFVGGLLLSKRGRKKSPMSTIFVPRDVEAEEKKDRPSKSQAKAYFPFELEALFAKRGTENLNIFDPKAAAAAAAKTKDRRNVILSKLPSRPKKQKKPVGPVSLNVLFGFNPFAKNATSQEESLIPEKWKKYYRKLIERKNALQARINDHSQKAFRKEGKEETGDVSAYSQHTADIDNEAFDRDFAISRLSAEQEELSEISIAIERMKKGTYGICEITGKPIPAERLNKVPFTRFSIQGKLEAEKQRGLARRRKRANATGDISEVIDIENDSPVSLPEETDAP